MKSFRELRDVEGHKTDKWDHYLDLYEELVGTIEGSPKILEIGTREGHSLNMWADRFSDVTVVGLDINEPSVDLLDNVHFSIVDQNDRESLVQIGEDFGPFDIIIDDASHFPKETWNCFTSLFKYTSKYYVIEDWSGFSVRIPSIFCSLSVAPNYGRSNTELVKRMLNELGCWKGGSRKIGESLFKRMTFEENILVIEKKVNE